MVNERIGPVGVDLSGVAADRRRIDGQDRQLRGDGRQGPDGGSDGRRREIDHRHRAGEDQAVQLVLVLERIAQRDRSAEAVAEQEQRDVGVSAGGEVDDHVEVGCRIVESIDERPASLRAPVTAVVDRVDGIAEAGQVRRKPFIAATVLTSAV